MRDEDGDAGPAEDDNGDDEQTDQEGHRHEPAGQCLVVVGKVKIKTPDSTTPGCCTEYACWILPNWLGTIASQANRPTSARDQAMA